MRLTSKAFILIFLLMWPLGVLAQDPPTVTKLPSPADTKTAEPQKKEKRRSDTYFKLGLARWQRNIFNRDLTQWQTNIFDIDHDLTALNMELETYFVKNHILLSGWSVGYRKDDIRHKDAGHMLSAKTFRSFKLRPFEIKASGGIEWGLPSLCFDKTVFDYGKDGSVRYGHTYPEKNSNVPGMGTTKDGAFYPFGELSLLKKRGAFLVEGGVRINVMKFGIDNYEVINDKIKYDFNSKTLIVPYLFFNVGIKI